MTRTYEGTARFWEFSDESLPKLLRDVATFIEEHKLTDYVIEPTIYFDDELRKWWVTIYHQTSITKLSDDSTDRNHEGR